MLHYTSIAYFFNHYLDETTDFSSEAGITFTARYLSRDRANEELGKLFGLWDNQGSSTDIYQKYKLCNCPYAFMTYCLITVPKPSCYYIYRQFSKLGPRAFARTVYLYVVHISQYKQA